MNELIAVPTAPTSEMVQQFFPRLLQEEPGFKKQQPRFSPDLATSYERSPNHLDLTFHLRTDACWSDGKPVTAEDVRWTWQSQVNASVAWAYSYMKKDIADVEPLDSHTVRFHFKRVYAKQLLDANEGGILPKHEWERLPFSRWRESPDWFLHHLVVDGPFTVNAWTPQQQVVLARNTRYFGEDRPYLERVVMRIIPDQASIVTQLNTGEIDFAPSISPTSVAQVAANPNLRLLSFWYRSWIGIAWNGTHEPFSDPGVRYALSLALDRSQIVKTLWGEFARVAESPIPTAMWAHNSSLLPLPYDPAEARRILAGRGYASGDDGVLRRGGKRFAFEIITNNGNQQRVDALVMIQAQLRQIGIEVVVRPMDFAALISRVESGDYEAALVGTDIDTSFDLSALFHSRSIGALGNNITHYSNREVDRLIDHSMSQPDIALAKGDLDRIQEILHNDQPYTFLWESKRVSAFNKRLHGVSPSLLFSLWNLKDWWIEPGTDR